jgi:Ca2+:H+ antiporter
LTLSRASAITLLVVYAIYLRFLLRPRVRHTVINDGEMMSGRASSFEFSDTRSISRLSRTIRFADEHSSDHESVKPDSASNQGLEMETMSEQDNLEDSASSDEASDSADVGQRQPLKPVRSHHRPPAYPRSPSYSRSRSSSLNGRRRLRHSDIAERYGGSVSDLSDSHLLPRTVRPPIASGLNDRDYSSDREQRPPIGRIAALVLLVVSSLLVAVCAELLVQTIAAITADSILSESFIGLIVLPIAGNAAEHITAVTVAAKGKVDLAIGVSFGSSIQIALFVNPLMVILGWVMKKDMSLYFGLFETATLIGVALLVNFLIWNGRTNYLEGTLLCACYVMIG